MSSLHTNVLVLLARIYAYFEPSSNISKVNATNFSHSVTSDVRNKSPPCTDSLPVKNHSVLFNEREPLLRRQRFSLLKNCSASVKTVELSKQEHARSVGLVPQTVTLCGSPVLRRSFTLNKQHTAVSASKAGLPIIEASQSFAIIDKNVSCGDINTRNEVGLEVLARSKDEKSNICNVEQIELYRTAHIDNGSTVPESAHEEFDQYLLQNVRAVTKSKSVGRNRQRWRQTISTCSSKISQEKVVDAHLNLFLYPILSIHCRI